ncbi:hypothetical protein APHCRT_1624 [Anaplasma phagocytophilum str. CRT53-1]|uniref:Uncharacterized protein n=1 Tax=Anaplasma phagocytophilum str. CRT53-1 TaxID=1359157 RepID=A0A0F3PL99_ANAPH|nr:hypothetical protein APHCRT_1624 [Anaplasma phagocytophilum str. CRT53-1]
MCQKGTNKEVCFYIETARLKNCILGLIKTEVSKRNELILVFLAQ